MVALARKTLRREWRRFVPAVLAIAFAGLLLITQAALVLGIFGSASVYVTDSSADLWAGYPGTQSVSLGRPISADVEMALRADPAVAEVAPMLWLEGDWRGPRDVGGVTVFLIGIDPRPGGLVFDRLLSAELRQRLLEPDTVIVDRADLDSLGVEPGQTAWIDGKRVHVIAAVAGLRALGGVNVIASIETARRFDTGAYSGGKVTYFAARLHDSSPGKTAAALTQVNSLGGFGPFQAWSATDFAQRSQMYWLFDTGAGVGVLFLALIVLAVGAVIASQSLTAVVIASVREYATLNALGVGLPALRWVVLEQSAWIGGLGLIGGAGLSALLLWLAQQQDVPVAMTAAVAGSCAGLIALLALASGLIAMHGLMRADPAILLR